MFQKDTNPKPFGELAIRHERESLPSNPATFDDNLHMHWSYPKSAMNSIQGDLDSGHRLAALITKARHPR